MHDFLMNEFKPQIEDELTKKLEIVINNSFKTHVDALMEDNHHTTMTLIEAFQNRFGRIEAKLRLKY